MHFYFKLFNQNIMKTLEVTSRQFRNNQKTFFDLADRGKQIIIRRGQCKTYSLSSIIDDNWLNPELEVKLDTAIKQYEQGEYTLCKNYEESVKFLESL